MNSRLKKIVFINMLLCAILIVVINILAYHSALGILVNIVLIPLFLIALLSLFLGKKENHRSQKFRNELKRIF